MGRGIHRSVQGAEKRTCRYCGADFQPRQAGQKFCEDEHRRLWHSERTNVVGRGVVDELVAIRAELRQLKDLVQELTDKLLRE